MRTDGEPQSKPEQSGMDFRGESDIHNPAPATGGIGETVSPYSVELHVEELSLHGFEMGDHHLIGEAFEREMARLVIERGLPPSFARNDEASTLGAQEFRVAEGSTPEAIGAQIARAIYTGLYGRAQ